LYVGDAFCNSEKVWGFVGVEQIGVRPSTGSGRTGKQKSPCETGSDFRKKPVQDGLLWGCGFPVFAKMSGFVRSPIRATGKMRGFVGVLFQAPAKM
jgi:hypothetical protein